MSHCTEKQTLNPSQKEQQHEPNIDQERNYSQLVQDEGKTGNAGNQHASKDSKHGVKVERMDYLEAKEFITYCERKEQYYQAGGNVAHLMSEPERAYTRHLMTAYGYSKAQALEQVFLNGYTNKPFNYLIGKQETEAQSPAVFGLVPELTY